MSPTAKKTEILLGLCIPGKVHEGQLEEVKKQVKKVEAEAGRKDNRDGLPLHLLDLSLKELQFVLLGVVLDNGIADNRAKAMAEKILAARHPEAKV